MFYNLTPEKNIRLSKSSENYFNVATYIYTLRADMLQGFAGRIDFYIKISYKLYRFPLKITDINNGGVMATSWFAGIRITSFFGGQALRYVVLNSTSTEAAQIEAKSLCDDLIALDPGVKTAFQTGEMVEKVPHGCEAIIRTPNALLNEYTPNTAPAMH